MRRSLVTISALATVALGACSPSQVVVTGQLEVPDPSQEGTMRQITLSNVIVDLLPFDRDVVFDSLTNAAVNPEPAVPQELQEAQAAILTAQQLYESAEVRWGVLRDTLEKLNTELARYNPAEPRYITLFNEYTDLESEYNRLERQVETYFQEYDELEKASFEQLQSIRLQRDNWANEAFAEVDVVFSAREAEVGRVVMTDTTNADGIAQFESVKEGQWWVSARYELATVELYWNFTIEVPGGGEVVSVQLDRAKAEERPKL